MGVPLYRWFIMEIAHRSKWMRTRGTPILGNHHIIPYIHIIPSIYFLVMAMEGHCLMVLGLSHHIPALHGDGEGARGTRIIR